MLQGIALVSMIGMAATQASIDDMRRARTAKPRREYQGHGTLSSANTKLNSHLISRSNLRTVTCEDTSLVEVRQALLSLFRLRTPELVGIYSKGDGRHSVYNSEAELEAHWAELPTTDYAGRQRDAHCHEAVMWFVHHLSTSAQEKFAQEQTLPLLPVKQHPIEEQDPSTKLYAAKTTCQKCHRGGLIDQGKSEVKPTTPLAISRRCYTNYKDLFNITCGPCDGLGGISTGDDDKDFTAPPCTVIAAPEDVPEKDRVKVKFPPQYAVSLHGSDRMGRTTNPEGSSLIGKVYGTMHGRWYTDIQPGADQWYLRHDVHFEQMYINGHKIPFSKNSETEIHVQSRAQRDANISGAMVTMMSGVPDWAPGGCTCIPDPVGVPDLAAAETTGLSDGMEYLGRIRLDPIEFLNETVELDHWANWFIHIFMATNKTDMTYAKAPRRIGSAYAGMAVYYNWTFADPKVAEGPDIWYRGIPVHPEKFGPDHGKFCMNPKKYPLCNNISQSTYPPPPHAPILSEHVNAAKSSMIWSQFHPFGSHVGTSFAKREAAAANRPPEVFV